jgi:ADYC domain
LRGLLKAYSWLAAVGAAGLTLQAETVFATESAIADVTIEGTAFRVRLSDGRALDQQDLVGAVLQVKDDAGISTTVRIDEVSVDPRDPAKDVVLYRLRALGTDGAWQEFCRPDPDGARWAFPLAGSWTASGEHREEVGAFIVACSSGAIGKCVRFGYKPWTTSPDGRSMWDLHQACVRMIRADYCGNGRANTRDGVRIEFYDRLGIQRPEPAEGMSFEAAWGPDGAVCVAHPRLRELTTLDGLARDCPQRLAGRLGAPCQEDAPASWPGAMLFNKS